MRKVRRTFGVVLAALAIAATGLVATSGSAGAGGAIGYVVTVEGVEPPFSCRLERLDLATGELTPLGDGSSSIERCAWDLAFDPDGTTLFGLRWDPSEPSTVSLVTFDTTTGDVTVVGQIGTFNARLANVEQLINGGGLTFDNDGTLYASLIAETAECTGELSSQFCTYTVDPSNPSAVTFLGPTTEPTGAIETPIPNSFAVACDGAFTGGQQFDEEGLTPQALTAIDRATGLGTAVAGGFGTSIAGMDYDFEGTLWGIDNPDLGQLYTIDRETGALTAGPVIDGFAGPLAIPKVCNPPEPVPEPIELVPTFTG